MARSTTNIAARNTAAPTISAGFVRGLFALAVARGADARTLTQRTGVDPAAIQSPDDRVPWAKYELLMRTGKALANDPALGLHFGEIDMAQLSIVGLIGRASETLAEAFAQFNRYARLAADVASDGERMALERRGAELWMIDRRENPNDFPEHTEAGFARMVCTSRAWLGDTSFMKAVHFTHGEPTYRAEYDRIFRMPVLFGREVNALVTDETWLTRKTVHASKYVFGVLNERADTLLEKLEAASTVRGRVEGLLMPILHTGNASMEAVAAKMGISRQTLFRKLKDEGVTFERVLDELRHRLALDYLRGEKTSVTDVAYLVGFSDRATFSRAFKRWTGKSPRTIRAGHQS